MHTGLVWGAMTNALDVSKYYSIEKWGKGRADKDTHRFPDHTIVFSQ